MSTVVALGHFCEVHGPRLVFYTIRNINEPQFVSQCPDLKFCSGCKAPLLEGYISTVQTVHTTPTQTPSPSSSSSGNSLTREASLCTSKPSHSTSLHRFKSSRNGTAGHLDDHHFRQPGQPPSSISCPSVSAPSTSTTPSATTKYYCSHSNYDHSHLSHLHTCIARTLSCELSPSNSVAFTSSDIWAIGTAFSLKDSQARGFHRKYCLIFTFLPETHEQCLRRTAIEAAAKGTASRDLGVQQPQPKEKKRSSQKLVSGKEESLYSDGDRKSTGNPYPSLVPYYDYITEEFYNISKSLLNECEKVYYKEQSVSPQRALRLTSLLDGESGAGTILSTGGCGSGAKVFTRSQAAGARSLPLLSANPHIFLDLHEKFARVLHHVDL